MGKKKLINFDSMSSFTSTEKQIWRFIISHLEYKDLFSIASVCKNFLILLNKDEMFWMLLSRNESKRGGLELPKKSEDWKKYYQHTFLMNWEKNGNFTFESSKIATSSFNLPWYACRTSTFLMQNFLYGFEVLRLPRTHLVIGRKKISFFFFFFFGN